MSQPGNTEVPEYLRRKLARQCVRSGCNELAADDSDECAPHVADSRERKKRSAAKRRQQLRDQRRCRDCKRKSDTYRCRRCERKNRRVDKKKIGVDKSPGNWREDPGTTWMRFRGKARRGRLTREEQIAEDARDARFAIEELEKFIAALGQLAKPEVMALPTIQREAAKRQVSQYLGSAGRFVDDLLDKYGG